MLKKLLPLIFIATSTQALSSGYIGIGVGPEMAVFKSDSHIMQTNQGNLEINVIDKNELSGNGWFGSLFAGYGVHFAPAPYLKKDLYAAAEVNLNISSLQHKSSNDEYVHMAFSNTSYRLQHNLGISILPGIQVNDATLVYARLGYELAKFKISTSDISLQNISENLDGFRCGIGVKQQLSPCYSARLEYSHIKYKSVNSRTLDITSNTSKTTDISPRTGRVELGFSYEFC